MLRNDCARSGVKIASAAVITEPGPEAQHVGLRCASQGTDIWKFFEKAFVVGKNGGDACLLQHDFGDPDAVGIAARAPRQVAFVAAIPGEEAALEFWELARGQASVHAAVFSHE